MDKIRIARKLIEKTSFIALHFNGGTHITFEDGNIDDASIEFCLDAAFSQNRLKCAVICAIMLSCTTEERADLVQYGGYNGSLEDGGFRTNEQIAEELKNEKEARK